MWLQIHTWFLGLRPLTQLLLLFVINSIFWFVAWEFYLWYFNETYGSIANRISFALWMSLVLTIPLNLKRWKLIFKKVPDDK